MQTEFGIICNDLGDLKLFGTIIINNFNCTCRIISSTHQILCAILVSFFLNVKHADVRVELITLSLLSIMPLFG